MGWIPTDIGRLTPAHRWMKPLRVLYLNQMKFKYNGKYKDCYIKDIPTSYLIFVLENFNNLNTSLESYIEMEICERLNMRIKYNDPKKIFKEMCLKYHPDKGGSHEAMLAILDFYEKLKS